MDRRDFFRGGLGGLVLATAAIGNEKVDNKDSKFSNHNTIRIGNIEYTIATDKQEYRIGEQVLINRQIRNVGDKKVALETFKDPEFDLLVQKYGRTFWRQHIFHKQFSPGIELIPGEVLDNPVNWSTKKSKPYQWDMKNLEEDFFKAGNYTVVGVVYAPNGADVTVPISISKKG